MGVHRLISTRYDSEGCLLKDRNKKKNQKMKAEDADARKWVWDPRAGGIPDPQLQCFTLLT